VTAAGDPRIMSLVFRFQSPEVEGRWFVLTTVTFFFFFFIYIVFFVKVQELHPPSPLHTRRLKSQHQEIITTFTNPTPSHGFVLEGGGISPLLSPSLRFIPLGFLYSGMMYFVFFDDVSCSCPAFALLD